MINPWPLLEINLVGLCRAGHVKYEYLPTYLPTSLPPYLNTHLPTHHVGDKEIKN